MSEATTTNPTTVKELRSSIRAYLDGEGSDGASPGYPLVKTEVADVVIQLGIADLQKHELLDQSLERLRYKICTEIEDDPDRFGYGSPFTKERLESIWSRLSESDEKDSMWPVSPIDVTEQKTERSLNRIDADTHNRRYEVLCELEEAGPSTSKELKAIADVPSTSVSSELTRLWENKLVDRTKRARQSSQYVYWVNPLGYKVVADDVESDRKAHTRFDELFGYNDEVDTHE